MKKNIFNFLFENVFQGQCIYKTNHTQKTHVSFICQKEKITKSKLNKPSQDLIPIQMHKSNDSQQAKLLNQLFWKRLDVDQLLKGFIKRSLGITY